MLDVCWFFKVKTVQTSNRVANHVTLSVEKSMHALELSLAARHAAITYCINESIQSLVLFCADRMTPESMENNRFGMEILTIYHF